MNRVSRSIEKSKISFIIPTLNSERLLGNCLKSIRRQDYPQNKIEILLIDGGSTDETKEIGRRHKATFVDGDYKDNQEARKGVGLHKASGEFVVYVDSDNVLPTRRWLNQMLAPLLKDPSVVASETWRYGIDEKFGAFSKYCALIGANDPVVFYLGKCDKLAWFYDKWVYTDILEETKEYVLVKFDDTNMPTMGGNGFMARREILLQSLCKPRQFFHIDVVLDIARLGHTKFAMVKNEILHDTAASLPKLLKRRVTYFNEHNPAHAHRRYLIFNPRKPKDVLNLVLFVFFALTLIQPLLISTVGYTKKRDLAWFLHPVVCLGFLYAYAAATVNLYLKK